MSATGTSTIENTLAPHSEQWPFLTNDERYYAFVSGVGAGKTVAGVNRVIKNIRDWNSGKTGVVIAPTVPALRNVIIPELDKWGVLDACDYNRSENRLDFPDDTTVILESADNDRKIERLRGTSIAWFWMDEAASISERAWQIMVARLRDGQYLNAFVTTTPKGKNWVHERFVPTADDQKPEVNLIRDVPTTANPHTPEEYKAEIVEEYEGQFYEQEVLGQFTQFEGLIYPWFDDDNLVDEAPDQYDEVIHGVDWGHNNPSTILALVRQGETWTAVEEHYETRQTVNDHSRAMQDMQDRWGPGVILCDPSEPANIDQFQRDGLDAKAAENDVTPGIQHVSSMREDLCVVETCQNLRNEFSQYQYKDGQDAPEKVNDHLMDSLRYALFTHTRPSEERLPLAF